MPHRSFRDNQGRAWEVWMVTPLFSGLKSWLCFETKGEKRRLTQFPTDWQLKTDEALCELCATAELARGIRRILE